MVKTPSKRRKKTRKSDSISFEELCEAAEVESLEDLEKAMFLTRDTQSIVPALQYSQPLDDGTFYAFNFPFIKFVYFSV